MFPKIRLDTYKGFLIVIILVLAVASLGLVTQPASASAKGCAQKHVVQRGESLYSISLQYGVNWLTIAQLNHLSSPYRLVSGDRLCISNTSGTTGTGTGTGGSGTPSTGGTGTGTTGTGTGGGIIPSTGGTGTQSGACSSSYKVVRGDSLFRIGQRFGVTWQALAATNRIKSPYTIFVGQTLCIPASSSTGGTTGQGTGTGGGTAQGSGTGGATTPQIPSTGGTSGTAACTTSHTVVSGESLFSLGLRYSVTWQELAVANRIKRPFRIFVGQTLCIPAKTSSAGANTGTGTNTGTSSGTGTTGSNTTGGTSSGTGGTGGNNNLGGGSSQSGGGQTTPGYTNP